MSAPTPVATILDNAPDLHEWDEGAPYVAPRLSVVPPPALAISTHRVENPAPKRSLGDRVSRVEFIADCIERMDDAEMDDATRESLTAELISELAGTRAKTDAVAATLAMFESLEAASEREMERLCKRVERYQRQRERLEHYVTVVMTTSKLDKLEGETSTLTLRKNPPAIQIADGATIPHEFLYFPEAPPPRADKGALKKALKAGRKIAGVKLESATRLVRS
jgi:chromosome segregation ATPase